MTKVIAKYGYVIATLAMLFTIANVNSTCLCWLHQPELPQGAEKLRKF